MNGSWVRVPWKALRNMMINYKYLSNLFAVVLCSISFYSCGLTDDKQAAELVAAKFYDALKTGNEQTAASFCAIDSIMTLQALSAVLNQNMNSLGKVTAYKHAGQFDVTKNADAGRGGSSTIHLVYNVDYEYGKTTDSLTLIKKGKSELKIYKYQPRIKEAKFEDELAQAQNLASEYLRALNSNNYEAAMNYIGYSGATAHAESEWNNFFIWRSASTSLTVLTINKDESAAYINEEHEEAGKGNIYLIVINTMQNQIPVTEEIQFFQPAFGQPLKIIAHNLDSPEI